MSRIRRYRKARLTVCHLITQLETSGFVLTSAVGLQGMVRGLGSGVKCALLHPPPGSTLKRRGGYCIHTCPPCRGDLHLDISCTKSQNPRSGGEAKELCPFKPAVLRRPPTALSSGCTWLWCGALSTKFSNWDRTVRQQLAR